jgi:hypothetical protein
MLRSSTLSLPFRLFFQNFECTFHLSHACHKHCPSHPWYDPPNNIWWKVQVMKLFIIPKADSVPNNPSKPSCSLRSWKAWILSNPSLKQWSIEHVLIFRTVCRSVQCTNFCCTQLAYVKSNCQRSKIPECWWIARIQFSSTILVFGKCIITKTGDIFNNPSTVFQFSLYKHLYIFMSVL